MNQKQMIMALKSLDKKLPVKAKLLLGGGGAMVLAHHFPLATHDLDAIFYRSEITEADVHNEIEEVAKELDIPSDWLNPYFQSFLYTLPSDFGDRLILVFQGKKITVQALGAEDLLVLKCFAGRDKDIPHAKVLVKKGLDTELVENHLQKQLDKNIPKSQEALDFFFDLIDELEENL